MGIFWYISSSVVKPCLTHGWNLISICLENKIGVIWYNLCIFTEKIHMQACKEILKNKKTMSKYSIMLMYLKIKSIDLNKIYHNSLIIINYIIITI